MRVLMMETKCSEKILKKTFHTLFLSVVRQISQRLEANLKYL